MPGTVELGTVAAGTVLAGTVLAGTVLPGTVGVAAVELVVTVEWAEAVELVVAATWPLRELARSRLAVFVPPQAARANAKTTRTATATPPLSLTTLVTLGRPSRFLLV